MLFGFGRKKTLTSKDKIIKPEKKPSAISRMLNGMSNLIFASKSLDNETTSAVKELLISADIGLSTTNFILDALRQKFSAKDLANRELLQNAIADVFEDILAPCNPADLSTSSLPCSILMLGVNGAGKTTTCGKLSSHFASKDKTVVLAAGDTFRAAAIEQLQLWGDGIDGVTVIAQSQGADSASVVYDGFNSALRKKADYFIADTAGRLHTQSNLMAELKKIKAVMAKLDDAAPHHTWLVLDASIGQNNIQQVRKFQQQVGITGLVITKLDGLAKGGSIFAIAKELVLPIYYVGVGERAEDLKPFNSKDFIDNIFS